MKRSALVTYQGREMTLSEALEIAGIGFATFEARYRVWGSVRRALEEPIDEQKSRKPKKTQAKSSDGLSFADRTFLEEVVAAGGRAVRHDRFWQAAAGSTTQVLSPARVKRLEDLGFVAKDLSAPVFRAAITDAGRAAVRRSRAEKSPKGKMP